mgnify:CR=1 FL=1
MIIVNTDYISGKKLQTISLVRGSTVHSKNIGRDILSGLKTIVGGEISDYTNMMNEARAIATKRMVDDFLLHRPSAWSMKQKVWALMQL